MIHLWRTCSVQTYDAEATVALGHDRPELLAVAQLAQDAERPIVGMDVTQQLLGGLPEHIGWLVIRRCAHLGLLIQPGPKEPATLSDSGRLALGRGEVLTPEEGVFRFYLAEDPLLDVTLLHVARLQGPDASESRRELSDLKKRNVSVPKGEGPPFSISRVPLNQVLTSVLNRSMFELRDAPRIGQAGPDGSLRLDLRWEADRPPTIEISGRLAKPDGAEVDASLQLAAPSCLRGLAYDSMWSAVVSSSTGVSEATLEHWMRRARKRVLPLTFDSTTETARRSFSCDVDIPSGSLERLGSFESSQLRNVALVPSTEDDAQAWSDWLQWDALEGYVMPSIVDSTAADVRIRFAYHSPRPQSAGELLARARRERSDRRSWSLLAPADLGLWSAG